jgi:hypothetical protein
MPVGMYVINVILSHCPSSQGLPNRVTATEFRTTLKELQEGKVAIPRHRVLVYSQGELKSWWTFTCNVLYALSFLRADSWKSTSRTKQS